MHPSLSRWLADRLLDRADGFRCRVRAQARMLAAGDRQAASERAADSDRALAGLLEHARTSVPFYRDALGDAPVSASSARDALRSLPIVDKDRMRADPAAFYSDAGGAWFDNSTGGSSGRPFAFRIDRERQLAGMAAHEWANGMAGWFPGCRTAMLWGASLDVEKGTARLRAQLRNGIENVRWYNAFQMGPENMQCFQEHMRRFAPHILIGYAGSLFEYARFLEGQGAAVGFPLVSLVSSAEVLTPAMREKVERVFGKPVFDRYGSREFGPVAAECEAHAGLHINEHDGLVEIDSPDPEKVPGRLMITYLRNRAMPFIRYDTGDLATFMSDAPCACGRTTRRLARIVGRESDSFRTADGRIVHGEYFTHVLYGTNDVRAFQFVQETLNQYRLLLEADRERTRPMEAHWLDEIRKAVGPTADIRIEYVPRIPPMPSGKRKFTLSRVGS